MLDAEDLDRIGDKVKLAVHEGVTGAMDKHIEKVHEPLNKRVDKIGGKILWAGGFVAAIAGLISLGVFF